MGGCEIQPSNHSNNCKSYGMTIVILAGLANKCVIQENIESDSSKHVDIVGEDSTYLSKLDNICNDIQAMNV